MNELICEMCGSNNIIKQDGLYVCQSCGTKYSVEEARKMMTGETVEVEGTDKIDSSTDLQNLYEIARRAKDTNNSENVIMKYFLKIQIVGKHNFMLFISEQCKENMLKLYL